MHLDHQKENISVWRCNDNLCMLANIERAWYRIKVSASSSLCISAIRVAEQLVKKEFCKIIACLDYFGLEYCIHDCYAVDNYHFNLYFGEVSVIPVKGLGKAKLHF